MTTVPGFLSQIPILVLSHEYAQLRYLLRFSAVSPFRYLSGNRINQPSAAPRVFAAKSQEVSVSFKPTIFAATSPHSNSSFTTPSVLTRVNTAIPSIHHANLQGSACRIYPHNTAQKTPPPIKWVMNCVCCPAISGDGMYHDTKNNTQANTSNQERLMVRPVIRRKIHGRNAHRTSGTINEISRKIIQGTNKVPHSSTDMLPSVCYAHPYPCRYFRLRRRSFYQR